jgi:hypothetical protein
MDKQYGHETAGQDLPSSVSQAEDEPVNASPTRIPRRRLLQQVAAAGAGVAVAAAILAGNENSARSAAGPAPGPGQAAGLPTPSGGPRSTTLYVSKLGDNTDGSSWAHALATIQAALDRLPDDAGGHRIVVRPDTYFEANLYPSQKGAAGHYNELIGDRDGKLGSGTTGWVVIDSSDPDLRGFKSYDWWGPIRAYSHLWSPEHTEATFSAIGWDRWRLSGLYATGGDGGLFFDCTDQVKPFTVVVEDCISIGRAFGGGVASCLSRPDEPITYRRCQLWALDWVGDTAAAYVRCENKAMPARPDAVFEDCTLISPQCALKVSNYGFHTFTRVHATRTRFVVLNFSQPAMGAPSDGIIQSMQEGKLLHAELEDCTLMGYKVFGVKVEKETVGDIGFTLTGDVRAYVQFLEDVPKGMTRLDGWPADVFSSIAPPPAVPASRLIDRQLVARDLCEVSPFIWRNRLCLLKCIRPATGGTSQDYYLLLVDIESGQEIGRCGEGHGLASAFIHNGRLYVFASRWENSGWRDVTVFHSADLKHWHSQVVLQGENEGVFNTSVCKGRDGFVMAYETNDPAYPAFTIKFAQSKDLMHWTKLPQATFGTNRYTACPCIRYVRGYYYVLYLEQRSPQWLFETYITRSKDLIHWELSAANPVIRPEGLDEGIDASDPDIVEWHGKTRIYFAVGDQRTWANIKQATWPGRLADFFASWYSTPGIPDRGSVGWTYGGAAA